jgi:hypothetical protein
MSELCSYVDTYCTNLISVTLISRKGLLLAQARFQYISQCSRNTSKCSTFDNRRQTVISTCITWSCTYTSPYAFMACTKSNLPSVLQSCRRHDESGDNRILVSCLHSKGELVVERATKAYGEICILSNAAVRHRNLAFSSNTLLWRYTDLINASN